MIIIDNKEYTKEQMIREIQKEYKILDEEINFLVYIAECCEHDSLKDLYLDFYAECLNCSEMEY